MEERYANFLFFFMLLRNWGGRGGGRKGSSVAQLVIT